METIMQNIDWMALFTAIWTIILVPIGKELLEYFKSKKLDGYAIILYDEVIKAVKGIQESVVKEIKGTEEWDDEMKDYVRELAKKKAIQALSTIAYRTLKEANEDFEEYLDGLVDTALFDIKNGLK